MIGRTVSHYEILARLGSGGMGDVYRARDRRLDRTVVLKFLPPARADDAAARERFLREAQAASRLDHASICTIYDIEELDDGTQFICMAHCDGESLADRLATGPLPPGEAARIALRVAEGLACAHDNGVIHRDLKPSNIQITSQGEVKILDFGVARLAGQERLTMTGTAVGTLPYMAPEQIRNAEIDHRCDLWSLGVLLHEMLTGQRPFRAEDPVGLMRVIVDHPAPDPAVLAPDSPPDLVNLVRWCLEKDPDERPQRAADLIQPLAMQARLSDDATVTLTPGSAPWRPPRRGRMAAVAAVLVALALLLATFLWPTTEVRSGVVLLPWEVIGGQKEDQRLADGLVQFFTGELLLLEPQQPEGWIAPASEVREHGVTGTEAARGLLGAGRVISGRLHIHDNVLRLELLLHETELREGEDLSEPPRLRKVVGSRAELVAWTDDILEILVDMLGWRVSRGVLPTVSSATHSQLALLSFVRGLGAMGPFSERVADLGAASEDFRLATTYDPDFAAPRVWLGRLEFRGAPPDGQPDPEAALAAADSAIALSPGLLDAHFLKGRILKERDPAAAIAAFRRCLELVPGHRLAQAWLADSFVAAGEADSAAAVLRRCLERRPDDPEIHGRLGALMWDEGRYEVASRAYTRMIALAPNLVDGYTALGSIAWQEGRWEDADAMFQRAQAVARDYTTYLNLGTIFFYQRRLTDAGRMYELATRMKPGDPLALGWAAECYWWGGTELERARELYAEAAARADSILALRPGDREMKANLASYLIRLGDVGRAGRIVEELAAAEVRGFDVPYILASCFEDLGDRERAVAQLERALRRGLPVDAIELNPGLNQLRQSPEYAAMLARVEDEGR